MHGRADGNSRSNDDNAQNTKKSNIDAGLKREADAKDCGGGHPTHRTTPKRQSQVDSPSRHGNVDTPDGGSGRRPFKNGASGRRTEAIAPGLSNSRKGAPTAETQTEVDEKAEAAVARSSKRPANFGVGAVGVGEGGGRDRAGDGGPGLELPPIEEDQRYRREMETRAASTGVEVSPTTQRERQECSDRDVWLCRGVLYKPQSDVTGPKVPSSTLVVITAPLRLRSRHVCLFRASSHV